MRKQIEFKPEITNEIQRKKLASGIVKNAIRIGTKSIAWVPVELLNIQPYQRKRQRHVTQIAENWDDAQCNVCLVSYDEENGWFNLMDGQHRGAAARMRGVEYLVCEIFTGMTLSKEAAMFVSQNENTKKLSSFDKYEANQFIDGEDETELSIIDKRIAAVCKKFDVKVAKTNGAGALKSVPVSRKIIRRDGEDGLIFVVSVIQKGHWDNYKNGYGSDLMQSLGKIYFSHKNDLQRVRKCMYEFFVKSTPDELVALSNNTYPNLTRGARLDAILEDIIRVPDEPKSGSKKVTKIA